VAEGALSAVRQRDRREAAQSDQDANKIGRGWRLAEAGCLVGQYAQIMTVDANKAAITITVGTGSNL
jgi:hypothetical protein